MIMAVTGHRPDKLWGYDMQQKNYQKLSDAMKAEIINNNVTGCISGMALGVDTLFALAVLELNELGNRDKVYLECAIPCAGHPSRWNKESQEIYQQILKKADVITNVSTEPYKPWLMQRRNEYMVDTCDILLAIWDGSSGGTANCIDYARKIGKPIIYINPNIL